MALGAQVGADPMSDAVFSHLPVALYARFSVNPDGKSDSVASQLSAGRRYCAATWPGRPILEFSDDNKSGADESVYRPGYEAMLNALKRREVGDVAAKMQGRITRQPAQWDDFRAKCITAGIADLHTWTKGLVGLGVGRALAGQIMNLIDNDYVETVKLNVADKLNTRALDGRPHGGAPYGYTLYRDEANRAWLVVDEFEKARIEEMVDRFLRGHTFAAIARWLNDKGVPTKKKAGQWTGETVKGAITNPTVTGYRVHRRKAVHNAGNCTESIRTCMCGVVGEAEWEAVIPRETWEAIRAIITAPRQVTKVLNGETITVTMSGRRRASDDYVLSGVSHCGRCEACLVGGQMYHRVGTARRTEGRSTSYYLCKKRSGGCNGLGIKARETEEFVTEGFMDFLGSPAFGRYLRTVDKDRAKRAKLQHQIDGLKLRSKEAGAAYASGRITIEALAGVESATAAEASDLQAQMRALAPSPVMDDPGAIRDDWAEMTVGEQRELLGAFSTRVLILPAWDGNRFSYDRIERHFGVV